MRVYHNVVTSKHPYNSAMKAAMAKSPPLSIRLKADLRAVVQKIAKRDNRSLGNVIDTNLRKAEDIKSELEREAKRAARA